MHKEACKCQWFSHYHKGTIFFPYFSLMHFYICRVSLRNFKLTVIYLIFLLQSLILDMLKSNKRLSLAPDGLQYSLKWKKKKVTQQELVQNFRNIKLAHLKYGSNLMTFPNDSYLVMLEKVVMLSPKWWIGISENPTDQGPWWYEVKNYLTVKKRWKCHQKTPKIKVSVLQNMRGSLSS